MYSVQDGVCQITALVTADVVLMGTGATVLSFITAQRVHAVMIGTGCVSRDVQLEVSRQIALTISET